MLFITPCRGSRGCPGTGQTPAWWEEMSRLPPPRGATCPQQRWHSLEVSALQRWWSHSEEVHPWSLGITLLGKHPSESDSGQSTGMP